MQRRSRKSALAASVAVLLFSCLEAIGLALAPGHLPANMKIAHAAGESSCSNSAQSSPTSGPVGAVIAVCGSGWTSIANGTLVSFGYSTDPNCASNNTIVQDEQQGTMEGGSFSGWFVWPLNTSLNTYTVCAFIANIATPPANLYTVLSTSPPRVTIAPALIHPGQLVTVTGSNYLPGGTFVSLIFQTASGSTSFGSTISDNNGSFSLSKNLPQNSLGSDMIVANAGAGQQPTLSASVTFTVSNAPPTPHSTPTTMPTATSIITPTAFINATATGIAQTPTTVSATTPVATQNAAQTPVVITPNTTQHSGGTGAGSSQSTSSPLPLVIGVGILLILLAGLLMAIRVRNRRKRAAELEKALAPENGPPWVGGDGLLASYRNNSMHLAPHSAGSINNGQVGPLNGAQVSNVPMNGRPPTPMNAAAGVRPTAGAGNPVGQGQSTPFAQSQSIGLAPPAANGAPLQAPTSASIPPSPDADMLLEAKKRQAQMGLFALARARHSGEEQ